MVLTVKVMSKGRRASSQVLPPFQYMCRKRVAWKEDWESVR